MSAAKHPRKPRKFPEGELTFRTDRGQEAAEHRRKSAKPQRFTGTAKVCRKRPSGRLAP